MDELDKDIKEIFEDIAGQDSEFVNLLAQVADTSDGSEHDKLLAQLNARLNRDPRVAAAIKFHKDEDDECAKA